MQLLKLLAALTLKRAAMFTETIIVTLRFSAAAGVITAARAATFFPGTAVTMCWRRQGLK
jgi:hypothetical protein